MTNENQATYAIDIEELKAQIAPVEMNDVMAEAGRKILITDFVQMLENEAGSRIGDDIEFVHDMRVATRRMRSAFRQLGGFYKSKTVTGFTKDLKKLAVRLGDVRDLDVLIAELQTYQDTLEGDEQSASAKVIEKLDKRRKKARKKLVKYLDGDEYITFLKAFSKFLTKEGKGAKSFDDDDATPHQVRHVLPSMVHNYLAQVRAYDTVLADADHKTLHELRKSGKRLRYIVAYFTDVLGSQAEQYIDELKAIQDHLGHLQDIVVAQDMLQSLVDDGMKKSQRTVINDYIAHINTKRPELIAEFPDLWERFNTRTVQQKLANALLVLR